jgi:hypothetical protein
MNILSSHIKYYSPFYLDFLLLSPDEKNEIMEIRAGLFQKIAEEMNNLIMSQRNSNHNTLKSEELPSSKDGSFTNKLMKKSQIN